MKVEALAPVPSFFNQNFLNLSLSRKSPANGPAPPCSGSRTRQLRCGATRCEEHVTLWMSTTDPVHQGSLPVDRGAVPQQHPMQEPLFSHPGVKPFDHLLARALGAPVTLTGGVGNLLVLWQVLYHSFRGALHHELGHDGACHGHDRRDREISLVSADEAHPSVLLRSRPATVPGP